LNSDPKLLLLLARLLLALAALLAELRGSGHPGVDRGALLSVLFVLVIVSPSFLIPSTAAASASAAAAASGFSGKFGGVLFGRRGHFRQAGDDDSPVLRKLKLFFASSFTSLIIIVVVASHAVVVAAFAGDKF
jgi:hypothetical protein